MKRRTVLCGTGAVAASTALSGCISSDSENGNPVVYATSESDKIYVVDAKSGEEINVFDPSIEDIHELIVYDGTVFFGNGAIYESAAGNVTEIVEGGLHGIDPNTGEIEFELTVEEPTSAPIIYDGVAYLRVNTAGVKVYAVELESNEILWTFEESGSFINGLIASDETIYIGANTNEGGPETTSGSLFAVDINSGEVLWEFDQPDEWVSQPAMHKSTLYARAGNTLYAVDAESGDDIWTYEEENLREIPVVANDTVFIFDGPIAHPEPYGHVHALEPETGERKWLFDDGEDRFHQMTIAHDRIYASAENKTVYAIDIESGELEWTYDTEGQFGTDVTVYDGLVYISDDGEALHAVDAFSGEEEWILDPDDDSFENQAPTVVETPEEGYSADSRVKLRIGSHHYKELDDGSLIDNLIDIIL